MTDTVNNGLKIGNPDDPARIAARLTRLRQSAERAEGSRKTELDAEIARHTARLTEIRAALDAALV